MYLFDIMCRLHDEVLAQSALDRRVFFFFQFLTAVKVAGDLISFTDLLVLYCRLHEEVLAQRALDRRLTEELMRFKNTIGQLTRSIKNQA